MSIINEMKIQVESQEDIQHVYGKLERELNIKYNKSQNEKKRMESYLQERLSHIFDIVKQNVQVNGYDWHDMLEEEEGGGGNANDSCFYEPVDDQLHRQLQELKLKLDSQLVKVCQMRREYPNIIQTLSKEAIDHELKYLSEDKQNHQDMAIVEEHHQESINKNVILQQNVLFFQQNMEQLREIKKEVPQLVAKMKDIQQVLLDKPRMDKSQTEKIIREG